MLREIKIYSDIEQKLLKCLYFKDKNNLIQGLYKHFSENGNIKGIYYVIDSMTHGVVIFKQFKSTSQFYTKNFDNTHGIKIIIDHI